MNSYLLTLSTVCFSLFVSVSNSADKPNVLFIAIDDLRVELGCYGSDHILSPNIDQLATRSTLFKRAYCQQAVCNPSRASMLTGLRLDTLKVYDLPTHFREHSPNIVTLPQLFKQNGYHTQCIGKVFHNWRQDKYKGDPDSWSLPSVLHYGRHGDDKAQVSGVVPENLSDIPKCVIRDVPDQAYFDGRIAELAVKALNQLKDQPFFLAVGFWKPHAHFNAPKKYWDLYQRENVSAPSNSIPPKNVPELALHDCREIYRDFKNRPKQKPTLADQIAMRHGYYAAISYMDAQIGKVLNELERLNLRKNTIIVLWSDHGYHLGEHGLWAKTSNFELDARVPVLISTPNQSKPQVSNSIIELLDIYPTLADLCQIVPPANLAGKSLKTVLENPESMVKKYALTQHSRPAYPTAGKDPDIMGYSIRGDRYRYTEWRDFKTSEVKARELYDHQLDPNETINIAVDASNSKTVKKLHTALEEVLAN